jgi:hypothetical protein
MFRINSLLIALFVLSANSMNAQVEAGLGVATVKFKENDVLNFYAEKESTEVLKTIEFTTDPTSKKVVIKGYELVEEWLKPEEISLDNSYIAFRCIFVKDGWVKVMVSEEENYWIQRNESVEYKDWPTLLASSVGVARLAEYPQKVREGASDNATNLKYEGTDCFEVKSVKGDWIEISATGKCNGRSGDNDLESGWIRWKKANRIQVQYYLR